MNTLEMLVLLSWFVIGMIVGGVFMYYGMKVKQRMERGVSFSFCGVAVTLSKTVPDTKTPNVAEIAHNRKISANKKEEKPVENVKPLTCDFCEDENIYLAGSKNIMPCPKCKKNAKKEKRTG